MAFSFVFQTPRKWGQSPSAAVGVDAHRPAALYHCRGHLLALIAVRDPCTPLELILLLPFSLYVSKSVVPFTAALCCVFLGNSYQDAVGRSVWPSLPGGGQFDGLCYPPWSWSPPHPAWGTGVPCSAGHFVVPSVRDEEEIVHAGLQYQ